MTSIRIIATPAGEAPEAVRQAWIGIVLPLPDKLDRPISHAVFGVLTGPKGIFQRLIRSFSTPKRQSYFVAAKTAIELLAQHNPSAAKWWFDNTPQYLISNKWMLCFEPEVCEVIPQTNALVPQ